MNAVPWRYQLLIYFLSPILVVLTLWKAWQHRNKRFAVQRLGYGYQRQYSKPLWIHCASVGEVTAALPLIRRLKQDSPHTTILVTTTTPTGADTVQRQHIDAVQHAFLPLDTIAAVKRFYAAHSPSALILMETELWPNLINVADQQQLPVVIVNGRLSRKTLSTPDWFKVVYRQALSKITSILAKSDQDAYGFEQLGADKDKVSVVGNIKFASIPANNGDYPCDISRSFWLAASTHEDEELQLCTAMIKTNQLDKLLVIAPRHPERSAKIQQALVALEISLAVRSQNQEVTSDTQVYLADKLGEMNMWLSHAEVVFMGGSLVPVGGHNLLEPAAAACPIVSGPHLGNFQEEADILIAVGALQQADTADEVIGKVAELLCMPQLRLQQGEAGRKAILHKADVLQRYIDALRQLIPIN